MSDFKTQESTLIIEAIEIAYLCFTIHDARTSGSSFFDVPLLGPNQSLQKSNVQ